MFFLDKNKNEMCHRTYYAQEIIFKSILEYNLFYKYLIFLP